MPETLTLAFGLAPPAGSAESSRLSTTIREDVASALGVPSSRLHVGAIRSASKHALHARVGAPVL